MPALAGNIWYFGNQAGLDFNNLNGNGDPIPVIGTSQMKSLEGCSIISDSDGKVLFYSEGVKLWDGQNNLVTSDLHGSPTSDESCIAVPHPSIPMAWILYTIADKGTSFNLEYNILRNVTTSGLTLNNIDKNIPLYGTGSDDVIECIQTLKNNDGSSWVIVMHFASSGVTTKIIAIKLKADGTFGAPVESTVPITNQGGLAGQMRISPSGTKIAKAGGTSGGNGWHLYDFDQLTGIVSNPRHIVDFAFTYGLDFSFNENLVYTNYLNTSKVFQWDITSGNPVTIAATKIQIGDASPLVTGKIQHASNSKLYVSLCVNGQQQTGSLGPNFIAAIDNPDTPGVGCGFRTNVALDNRTPGIYSVTPFSILSLPTFDGQFVKPVPPPPPPDPIKPTTTLPAPPKPPKQPVPCAPPELSFLDRMKCCVAEASARYIFLKSRGEDVEDMKLKVDKLYDAIKILERYRSHPTQRSLSRKILKSGGKSLSSKGKLLSLFFPTDICLDPDVVNTVTNAQAKELKEFLSINCSICNCE